MATCLALSRLMQSPIRVNPPHAFLRLSVPRKCSDLTFLPRKVSVVLAPPRASPVDVAPSIAVRPGRTVETDNLPAAIRDRTIEAVEALGRRVTIGDVAGRAGIKVDEAQKALQALAADTDGCLEVSDDGDVLYFYPKDFRSKLAAKSFRMKAEPIFEKTKGVAEYLIRVLFGTTLIASIVIVFTAIFVIISSNKSDDNGRRRRGRAYDSGFNFYIGPSDLFWFWDRNSYRRRQYERVEINGGKMNFVESVFSFVFGDGDPNQGIEEERWKLIGQYIASNGGVVAAEELAPYLDVESSSQKNDESYILPVLLRFEGDPEVDEEGHILYRFPSLQRTASQESRRREYVGIGRKWTDFVGQVDVFLREKELQFSQTSASERALVIGLGGLNLFGVVVLGAMLKETTIIQGGFISYVQSIFPLLQIYAGSFFAIPFIRWLYNVKRNANIQVRNKARADFAKALETPNLALRRKLLSARDMAQKTVIGQDRIVYRSDRDIIDQDYEAQDWDRRFREIEKTD